LCGEWIEVDIKEASDAEAPVAMRWKDDNHCGSVTTKETRWFEGHHYAPKFNEKKPLTAETLCELCLTGTSSNNPLIDSVSWQAKELVNGKVSALSDLVIRQLVSTDRDDAMKKALHTADSVVIVDGYIWTKVGEPVYEYGSFGIGVKHLSLTDEKSNLTESSSRFRADRLDDMIEHFQAQEEDIETRIDIYVSESVTYDDETPVLINCARHEVETVSDSLKEFPKHAVVAWVDLRDAYHALQEEASPEAIADLETTMRTFSEAYEDWRGDDVRRTLARWDLRPMSHDYDCSPSLSP